MLRTLALSLLLLAAPAAASAQPGRTAAAADLTQRVERTAEGGYRMGAANAPVKLVEYASIACSHCADFNAAAAGPLRERIRTGQLSWEVRPYLIFPSDPGIFLLLQCARPADFFTLSDELYAGQSGWTQRIEADAARLQALPARDQMVAVVRASGVEPLFRARGMSDARITACLSDRPALDRLIANHRRYAQAGVDGTPTFFINGRQAEAGSWAQLEPLLATATPRPAPGRRTSRRGR